MWSKTITKCLFCHAVNRVILMKLLDIKHKSRSTLGLLRVTEMTYSMSNATFSSFSANYSVKWKHSDLRQFLCFDLMLLETSFAARASVVTRFHILSGCVL